MAYDYILFDADDTLLDYAKAEKYALSETFKGINYNCTEYIAESFNKICDNLWHEFKLDQPLNRDVQINYHHLYYKYSIKRFSALKELLSINISAELLSEKYLHSLSKCSFLVEDAVDVCRQLSRKYQIFIVTNGLSYVQQSRIENSKIKPFVSDILISENAGCAKPGREFFNHLIKKIGTSNLSEMLIVGDSLMTDILGGNEYGIDTCWFNNKNKVNNLKIQPKFEIKKLTDLLIVLEKCKNHKFVVATPM